MNCNSCIHENVCKEHETVMEVFGIEKPKNKDCNFELIAPNWMSSKQKQDYKFICKLIDTVTTSDQFYKVCDIINRYDCDIVDVARESKKFFNSAQYM